MRQLQRRLEPHLLRRIKEDVATDIPAKEETIIDVELTTLQKQVLFRTDSARLFPSNSNAAFKEDVFLICVFFFVP